MPTSQFRKKYYYYLEQLVSESTCLISEQTSSFFYFGPNKRYEHGIISSPLPGIMILLESLMSFVMLV